MNPKNADIKVSNLDHLGIVAGIIDDLGIVEQINERIGRSSREKVSAGGMVKAMIDSERIRVCIRAKYRTKK